MTPILRVPVLLLSLSLAGVAAAQVQTPPNTVPAGETRQPPPPGTGPPTPGASTPANDCRRQLEAVRNQFQIQQATLRREMADRARLADETQKQRLKAEEEQRVAALRAESQQAERRVRETCAS